MPKPAAACATSLCASIVSLLFVVLALAGCAGSGAWSAHVPVAILISDTAPAYERVAEALRTRVYPEPRVFQLANDSRKAEAARRALVHSDEIVVAIGAFAVAAARGLAPDRIVFCQVFHYEEPGLIAATTRGVKATPPLLKQFHAWKLLNPRLAHIALVTGTGLADLPAEARRAARAAGLELTHIEVGSDKELMYAVRGTPRAPKALWIAPDHRVLNSPLLRELLAFAVRHGIAVTVFNHQLLGFGALMSVESDYDDVADRVRELVSARPGAGPRVRALRRVRIQVNPIVAKQFGLSVPPTLARGVYGS